MRKSANATISRNKDYQPVRLDANARKICKSWWGIAWCRNLERYADWENRIACGKTYLRVGAVVDLKINGGKIDAMMRKVKVVSPRIIKNADLTKLFGI